MKITFILFCLINFFSIFAHAADFSNIILKNWNKEILADDHLRFTSNVKKELVIHLQIDSFDKKHFWTEETLAADITMIAEKRKKISEFFGITNYQIGTFKLNNAEKNFPSLWLFGSYVKNNEKNIEFAEINFYAKEHFLQIKFITEGKLPSNDELNEIIKEISPSTLEID